MTKADLEEYGHAASCSSGEDGDESLSDLDPVPAQKRTLSYFTVQDRHVSDHTHT